MAEKRMFKKSVIDSDFFLDMPLSTQALYFHLAMRADDDGFVDNPKKICRMINASEDSMKVLIAKGFVIAFESGVVVITHWRVHNILRRDTYKETAYLQEKSVLALKESGEYELCNEPVTDTVRTRNEPVTDTVRTRTIDKISIDKISIDKNIDSTKRFVPPTVKEVSDYCKERNNGIDPEEFIAYYGARGWMLGKVKMKSWKQAIITWEKNRKKSKPEENHNIVPMEEYFPDNTKAWYEE